MNASLHALRAYGHEQVHLRPARSLESQVIGKVTSALQSAIDSGSFPALVAALHDNRRLWTRLAVAVADPANALPPALCAQLLSLAAFSDSHSQRVLGGDADPAILVEINSAILQGLGAQVPQHVGGVA